MKNKIILGLCISIILSGCVSNEKLCDIYIPTVSVVTYAKIKNIVDNDDTIKNKETVTDERYQLRYRSETGRNATDKNLELIKEMYEVNASQYELKNFKIAQSKACNK